MILLAGAGAVFLVQAVRGRAAEGVWCVPGRGAPRTSAGRPSPGASASRPIPAIPYVYAHTGTDVFEIVGRLKELARAHPDGSAMPLQIISRENLWPLPWYLRGFSRVAWWNGVSDDGRRTPR